MDGLNLLLSSAGGRTGQVFFQGSQERYRFTRTERVEPDVEIPVDDAFREALGIPITYRAPPSANPGGACQKAARLVRRRTARQRPAAPIL
ncbi:hypothetical protein [Pseudomonas protegens]|uniref:hypothetical protein n=1 Tax=Pseudomonas protegens TaxID=380021 RepID=UPI0039058F1F